MCVWRSVRRECVRERNECVCVRESMSVCECERESVCL